MLESRVALQLTQRATEGAAARCEPGRSTGEIVPR